MGHATADSAVPRMRLDASDAAEVATRLQAPATLSRLRPGLTDR
ncbi:hypothetical protein ACWCXH_23535 [Kitasatospora sp. NPDC001660]